MKRNLIQSKIKELVIYCKIRLNAIQLDNKYIYIFLFSDIVPIKEMDKWFCFAQSLRSGKVLAVFHAKGEEDWVVNFKKSIASAFQVNYKGTAVVNETDSQSKHKSHYK